MRHATMTALALVLGLGAAPAIAQSTKTEAPLGAAAGTGCIEANAPIGPESFNKLDDNGDGFVSKQEYVEKCGKAGGTAQSDDAATAQFAALDADRDQKLSADEFKTSAKTSADASAGASSGSSGATVATPGQTRADMKADMKADTKVAAPSAPKSAAMDAKPAASAPTGVEAQRIIGMDVINAEGKEVGEVKDLVLDQQQVAHAVVSVGGFLGIGAKEVAVPFEQLRVGQDNVTLMSESTEAELKQMPEYKKDSYTRIERKADRAAPPARPMGDAGRAPLPKE